MFGFGQKKESAPNERVEFLSELLRTLAKLNVTPTTAKYKVYIAECVSSNYQVRSSLVAWCKEGADGGHVAGELTHDQKGQIEQWVKNYPWYLFSLVTGLATDDEGFAWGLAFG